MTSAVQKRAPKQAEQQAHKPRRAASTHEQQAREAAARILSGEVDAARLLTHAPAAVRVDAVHGTGSPLPFSLREQFEVGFGADLSAVRLFFGANAAAVAEAEGANAFASGRDIFFAEGRYQPGSRDGQRLIAHEVAHVLQQTGMINSAGQLLATARYGSADVQREEPAEPEPAFEISVWRDGFRAIAVDQGLPQEEIDGLNEALKALENALAKDTLTQISLTSGKAAGVKALEREVLDKKWDGKPAIALTMLLDAFKIMGLYGGAAYILEKEPLLQTTGFWVPFAKFLDDSKGMDWFVGAFASIPQISKVFPDYLVAAVWRYLMHPHEPATGSYGISKLTKAYLENYEKIKNTVPLKDNERLHGAYHYLGVINREFEKLLVDLDSAFGDVEPAQRRRMIAGFIVNLMTQWKTHERLAQRLLAEPVLAVAKRAQEYWDRAESLMEVITGQARQIIDPEADKKTEQKAPTADQTAAEPAVVTLPEVPADVLADKRFAKFLTDTDAGLIAILGGTAPALLDAPAYQTALDGLRKSLGAHRTALSKAIDDFFKRQNMDDQVMFDRAVWYAVAQLIIDNLMIALGEYDKARESQFDKTYGGLPDVRLNHRFSIARQAIRFAGLSKNAELLAAAQLVNDGKDLGYSYLAFTGEWKLDTHDVTKLKDDFDDDLAVGGFGGTIFQLRQIYYLLRQQAIIRALTELLDTYKSDFSLETYGLIAQAQEAAKAEVPYPSRWLAEKSIVVWHESDVDNPARSNMKALIQNHPRYDELIHQEANADRVPLIAVGRPLQPAVWMLPNIDHLRDYLYGIPALQELLKDRTGPEPTLDELSWALDQVVQEARAAVAERLAREMADPDVVIGKSDVERELDALILAIGGEIGTDIYEAHTERRGLFVQATIHDRKVIEKAAGELLVKYKENHSVSNYGVPNRALDFIEHFSRNIFPDTKAHRDAQMAALMLNLAAKLKGAFIWDTLFGDVVEDRYDIITTLWPLLNDAIAYADGTNVKKEPTDKPLDQATVKANLKPYLQPTEDVDALLANRKPLEELRDAFRKQIERVQAKSGMRGSTSPQALKRVDLDRELPVGDDAEPFWIDGIEYLIQKVETDFRFHPSYGRRGSGSYVQSILLDASGNKIPRDVPIPLVTYIVNNGEPETITSLLSDEPKLEQLAYAATMRLIIVGLEETAAIIEGVMRAGVDIASLFVPGGPVAIMLIDLASFMATDMPVIRTDLIEAPMAVVNALDEFVSPEMREKMVEKFWSYLLFEGDLPFAEKIMAASPKKDKAGAGASARKGKFGKVAEFAKEAGLRLLQAFLNLRQRVRSGMIRAGRVIQRHPLLRQLLNVLPQLISFGMRIKGTDLEKAKEIFGDLIEGEVPKGVDAQFREALDQLFDGLNGLEVPAEILPLNLIADVVLERFLRTLGPKGKAINAALELTQGRQMLADKVAEVLKEYGADPNILWQQLAQEKLQAMLVDTRAELLAGINAILSEYLGDFVSVPSDNLPPIQVEQDSALPEMEALLAPDSDAELDADEEDEDSEPTPTITPQLGRPLSPAARLRYEKLFGHDLAHVRLHSDREADRLTEHYGAHALTSGSHIFLSEDTPPGSPRTDRILKHELAHVLQQTGARPLGFPNRPDPVLGEPGRGLNVDSRREDAAEQMARRTLTRGDSPVPVEDEEPLAGLMPELSNAMKEQVIRYLGSSAIAESFVEQIDSMHKIPGEISTKKRGQFDKAVTAATAVWTDVKAKMKAGTGGKSHPNPKCFEDASARTAFGTYLGGTARAVTLERSQIRALVFFSYHQPGGKLKLHYERFKDNLENYLSGTTGIDVKIHYEHAPRADKTRKVSHVNVAYVHLGRLYGNPAPWSKLRENTNKHMVTHTATLGIPFTDKEWQKMRNSLKGGTTDRDPWHDTEYRLSDAFIKEMRAYVNASEKGQVDRWDNYIRTDDIPNPLYGGLRVGTHGQLTGHPTKRADLEPASGAGSGVMTDVARGGRQSHHVPQFLLVEYFENDNNTPVARKIGSKVTFPPGFVFSGSHATGFDDGSGKSIDFAKLDPQPSNRGTGLPAISLAAKTHQKGKLHINAVSNWGDYKDLSPSIEVRGTGTQGATINDTFYKVLREELGYGKSGTEEALLTRAHSDAKAKPKVHKAIQRTYKWMYRGMLRMLTNTLTRSVEDHEHYEATEYETFALNMPNTTVSKPDKTVELKPEYQARNVGLSDVIKAVETKNRAIMKEWWID